MGASAPTYSRACSPNRPMMYIWIVSRKINKLYQIRSNELLESRNWDGGIPTVRRRACPRENGGGMQRNAEVRLLTKTSNLINPLTGKYGDTILQKNIYCLIGTIKPEYNQCIFAASFDKSISIFNIYTFL